MTRARIVGVALLVLFSAGLLTRVSNHAGMSPSPDRAPVEIRTEGKLLATESVGAVEVSG